MIAAIHVLALIVISIYGVALIYFNFVPRNKRCDKIMPLAKALNSSGLVNVFSLGQGYFYFTTFLVPRVVPPFVCFRTSVDVAKEIHKSAIAVYQSNNRHISTIWRVESYFDHKNELTFIFRSLELNEKSRNIVYSIWRYIVQRRNLDDEFVELAGIINKALLMYQKAKVQTKSQREAVQ